VGSTAWNTYQAFASLEWHISQGQHSGHQRIVHI
jgi:hypothetical protein